MSALLYLFNKVFNQAYIDGQAPWKERMTFRCTFIFIKSLNCIGLNMTLFNLMGMAVDHFVAITRPLHYQVIMTTKRVFASLVVMWILAIAAGLSDFFSGIGYYHIFKDYYNYCEIVWQTAYQEEYVTFALAFMCLLIMMILYIQIYARIHRHKQPGENRVHAYESRNNSKACHNRQKKNHKPLMTTLLILGSFVVCWLPMCIFQLVLIAIVKLNPEVLFNVAVLLLDIDQYLYALSLLNCIADPIIYAVRMKEVKLGYRRLFNLQTTTPRSESRRHLYRMTSDHSQCSNQSVSNRLKSSQPQKSVDVDTNVL